MDIGSVIVAIFGTLGSVTGAYFMFRGKKVEQMSAIRIQQISMDEENDTKKIEQFEDEKKIWAIKENELKDLLAEYSQNWASAVAELKIQTSKIDKLEKRIQSLEFSNKELQKRENNWIKRENKLLQELFKKK